MIYLSILAVRFTGNSAQQNELKQVKKLAEPLKKNAYGQYLLKMIKGY